nr:MAG TPA: hypothetical protein [Caudoviricetes sp.]DAR00649.1 MAG TPA: hypothetical protein [Crassvirales sp.]
MIVKISNKIYKIFIYNIQIIILIINWKYNWMSDIINSLHSIPRKGNSKSDSFYLILHHK